MLHLEKDAWSRVKLVMQNTYEHASHPPVVTMSRNIPSVDSALSISQRSRKRGQRAHETSCDITRMDRTSPEKSQRRECIYSSVNLENYRSMSSTFWLADPRPWSLNFNSMTIPQNVPHCQCAENRHHVC